MKINNKRQSEKLFSTNMKDKHNILSIKVLINKTRQKGRDFPGGAVVKNLPANAGDTDSIPGLGRSHMPRSN